MKRIGLIFGILLTGLLLFGCTVGGPSEVTQCQQETERISNAFSSLSAYPMSESVKQSQTDTCVAGYASTTNNKKLCDYIKTPDIKTQCLNTSGNIRSQSDLCSNGAYTTVFGNFNGKYLITLKTTIGDFQTKMRNEPTKTLESISDLTCLEYLWNYDTLDNNYLELYSFDSISNLVNLKEITLTYTQVPNLNALSGMKDLTVLNLYYNKVSDISALKNLNKLKILDLTSGNITDISILTGLTNLEELKLSVNPIKDFSPLKSMTFLKKLQIISDYTSQADCDSLTNSLPTTEVTCYGQTQTG